MTVRRAHLSAQQTDGSDLVPYVDVDELLAAAIGLFAKIPDLPKNLLEMAERDNGTGKVASLFDHIFEIAPSPTVGANRNVLRYRLRDVDQGNFALVASSGGLSNFDSHENVSKILRAAYDQFCLEQQLIGWEPKPDCERLIELFLEKMDRI